MKRNVSIDYGVVEKGKDGKITAWNEKPTIGYEVSTGIYVLEPMAIDMVPPKGPYDFPDLIKAIIYNGGDVFTYPFTGYWLDIGRKEDYEKACKDIETLKGRFL